MTSDPAASGNAFSKQVEARAKSEGAACVIISAKIEAEFAGLLAARLDTLTGAVVARRAKDGETVTALNGKVYALGSSN